MSGDLGDQKIWKELPPSLSRQLLVLRIITVAQAFLGRYEVLKKRLKQVFISKISFPHYYLGMYTLFASKCAEISY